MADLKVRVGSTILDEAYDVAFQDVLNDLGSGTMTLTYDDPDIATASVAIGSTVDVLLDSTVIGRWVIETVERKRIVAPESDTGYVYSGRTLPAELERTVVYPPRPPRLVTSPIFTGYLSPKPYSTDRHFGPMDPSYDTSAWSSATQVASPTGSLSPVAWNDPSAYWIGGDFDTMWLVKSFTTTGVFALTLHMAAADTAEFWLDGALMARIDAAVDEGTASKTRRVVVEVNDGTHYVAIRVNRVTSTDCLALFSAWGRGTTTNFCRTDNTWKILADTAAGYTPHQVVDLLLDEAQARSEATGWTLTSSASADTDSTAWTLLPDDFAVRAGDTLLDVLRQLSDAHIDFGVKAASTARQLSLWVTSDRGAASGVTWAEGAAVLSSTHRKSDAELRNRILIVWADGIIRGDIDASVTANGARSTLLNIGQVEDGPTALDVALATIEPMSDIEESVTLQIEPAGSDVPGVNVLLGDTVTAPDIDGTAATYRMSACSWEFDGDNVLFTPELATSMDVAEQRQQRWLTRTNHGTVNGRSRSATASSPSIRTSVEVVEPITVTFSTDGAYAPEVDDESAPKAADRAMRLVKLVANCTDAGVGATEAEMLNDNVLTGDSIELPASTTDADAYFVAGETFAYADAMAIRVTVAGGHSGISWTAHFVEPGG